MYTLDFVLVQLFRIHTKLSITTCKLYLHTRSYSVHVITDDYFTLTGTAWPARTWQEAGNTPKRTTHSWHV